MNLKKGKCKIENKQCWSHVMQKLKGKVFKSPSSFTCVFRSLIWRIRIGISLIIFSARSEIMVSISRSIPHS